MTFPPTEHPKSLAIVLFPEPSATGICMSRLYDVCCVGILLFQVCGIKRQVRKQEKINSSPSPE